MEKESRLQLGCALFTCLTMVIGLCAAGVIFGLGFNLNNFTLARSDSPARGGNPVDRIALIGEDGNVYTVDRKGQSKLAITSDAAMDQSADVRRAYVFPNWSPDDQQLASWVLARSTMARPACMPPAAKAESPTRFSARSMRCRSTSTGRRTASAWRFWRRTPKMQ